MHTLIISDVHLGSSVCRVDALLGLLEREKFQRLILNGDIFDDLDFSRLSHSHWELLSRIREFSNPKQGIEVVWIAGNHDGAANILSRLIGVSVLNEYIFEWNNKRCLVIHGHQFDRFLTQNPFISFFASWIYLAIQKVDTERQFISRHLKRMSKSWLRVSEKVARGAIRYASKKGVDMVFCGHTHKQIEKTTGSITYYNSGCWTDTPSAYISVSSRAIEIKEIN